MNKKIYNLMDWAGIEEIVYAEAVHPERLLGATNAGLSTLVQAFFPGAKSVSLRIDSKKGVSKEKTEEIVMEMQDEAGYFAGLIKGKNRHDYSYVVTYDDKKKPVICREVYDDYQVLSDDDIDKILGLEYGADDYITKPFRLKEVKARVKAVLRRSSQQVKESNNEIVKELPTEKGTERYEGLVLDTLAKTCTVDGVDVPLTRIEFELLLLLLQHRGNVLSRDKILDTVWPSDTIVLDRTVDVNITRLRRKIGEYGKRIRTRFGYGYTFER